MLFLQYMQMNALTIILLFFYNFVTEQQFFRNTK